MKIQKRFSSLLVGILSLVVNQGFASSQDAWAEHTKEVNAKCLKASSLSDAKAASEVILFDDSVGFDALLISGKANGQKSMELCLFNKAKGTANIAEAKKPGLEQTNETNDYMKNDTRFMENEIYN